MGDSVEVVYVSGYVLPTRNVQLIKKEDWRKIDLNPQNNYRLDKEITIYGWEWLTFRVQIINGSSSIRKTDFLHV